MAYFEEKRTTTRFDLVSSWVTVQEPYTDANGKAQYGTGYLSAPVRLNSTPFDSFISTRVTSSTPGFNWGNYAKPIRALGYSRTKEVRSAESFYETYYINVTSPSLGPGSSGYKPNKSWSTNVFQYPFGLYNLESWFNSVRDKATRKLLEAVKDSDVNLAVATAERRQTMNLFASTATRVASAALALKRGNFTKAARALGVIPKKRAGRRFNRDYPVDQAKAVGNAWLELQYGWKPLLSDVYGSAEALAKAKTGTNAMFSKKTGYASRQETLTTRSSWLTPSSSVKGEWYTIHSTNQKVFVKTGVTFSISSPAVNDVKKLGFTNPLLVAWELVPFSFVADWFLPIGNYLNSLDATLGLTFFDGYVSTKGEYFATNNTIKAYTVNNYACYYGTGTESRSLNKFTRTSLSGFPGVPRPAFKNPISTSHVASALALLLQTFKR